MVPDVQPPRRRRRASIALAVVVVLLVALRVALPRVVRTQLEQQLSGLIAGTVTVGDVDLWLVSGAVAAEDVALRPDGAAPDAPPLVAFHRLAIDIGWLGLFRRTARVEDVTLAGLEVHVDRLADGVLVLPGLRPTEVPAEPAPAPEEVEPSEPWAVLVDHVALVGGELEVIDHVPDPVERRVIHLPTLEARDLAFQPRPEGGAGRGALRIRIDEGEIDLRTRITPRPEGLAISAVLRVTDVPLDRLHVHAPDLGWSDSKGLLSLEARARIAPDGMPRVSGNVTLRDLQADVPGEERAAFLAKRLAVVVKRFSLLDRVADVTSVALEGAELVAYPLAPAPLPLLRGREVGAGGKTAGAQDGSEKDVAAARRASGGDTDTAEGGGAAKPATPEAPTPEAPGAGVAAGDTKMPAAADATPPSDAQQVAKAETATSAPADDPKPAEPAAAAPADDAKPAEPPAPAPPTDEPDAPIEDAATGEPVIPEPPKPSPADAIPEAPPEPWRWRVDEVTLSDAVVHLGFETEAIDVGVPRVVVRGVSSDFGSPLEVDAALAVSDGTLTAKGKVTVEPLSGTLEITAAGVGVGRLAGATGMAPVAIEGAALDADLDLAFGTGPLSLAGTVELADVAMTMPDEDAFAAGWESLAIGIRSLEMPGVLEARAAAGATRPVALALDVVTFTAPRLVVTRRAEGIVMPGAKPAAETGAATFDASAPPPDVGDGTPQPTAIEPAPSSDAPPAATVTLARFELEDGEIEWHDEAVEPAYDGTFEAIDLEVTSLEYPATTVGGVRLSLKGPKGGKVQVTGSRKGNDIALTSDVDGLDLTQFNPYMKASGYGLHEGRLSLETKADLAERGYDIANHIDLDDLQLGGAGTDAFFQESVGLPTSVAIGLLKDQKGRISLDIPLGGDRERGVEVKIGPIVAQALTKAIIGALASPLKLIGAVTQSADGRIESVAPSPVVFRPGSVEVSGKTEEQLVALGKGLGLASALGVALKGQTSARDRRARQEAAVLADLGKEPGFFGRLRTIGSGEERAAIQKALEARARGKKGKLPPELQEQLDEMVAEKSVSDGDLRTLASARAERVRDVLVAAGVGAERVTLEDPVVDAAEPAVDVALAEPTS
jgi:hypothetical protein